MCDWSTVTHTQPGENGSHDLTLHVTEKIDFRNENMSTWRGIKPTFPEKTCMDVEINVGVYAVCVVNMRVRVCEPHLTGKLSPP